MGNDLNDTFSRDGHLELIALSVWGFVAVLVDFLLFSQPLLSEGVILMLVVALVPLVYLMSGNRHLRTLITVGNLFLTLWAAWVQSPKAY